MSRRAASAAVITLAVALAVTTPAQAQKTLRIAMTAADIPTTTGLPNNGFEGMRFLGYPIFEPMIDWDLTKTEMLPPLRPGLATDWAVDGTDRTKWVFKLRAGVTFHDGTPFNADSVVWNLGRFYDDKSPQYEATASAITRARVPLVDRWEKIDDMTVAIYTKRPISYFPYQVTVFLMGSPTAWEKAGRSWTEVAKGTASGTGPFKIAKVTPRVAVELARNDAYWNKDRVPKVDRVVLTPMPEATTRLAALRSGQMDWIEVPPPDAIPSLKDAKFQIATSKYPHIWPYYLKSTEDTVFRDKRVRQAANYAVDRDALVKFLNGTADPAVGYWPPSHPNFGNPENKYRYDPAKSKALLKEAGYDKPVKIKVQISTSGSGQMLPLPMNELIQQSMATAGFEVEFDVVEWGQMLVNSRQSTDAAVTKTLDGFNQSSVDGDYNFIYRWFHSASFTPVSSNWPHWKNAEFDGILNKLEVDFSGNADKSPELTRAHEILVDDPPWLWIVHDLNPRAFVPKLKGYIPAQSWFNDFTQVTLD
jgi:peptide/nickel transport system substrate-binding protein